MSRAKVVIAAFDFLPYVRSFGAAQRVYYMAKWFAAAGENVEVICAKGRVEGTFGIDLKSESFTISEFDSFAGRYRASRGSAGASGDKAWIAAIVRRLKSCLPVDYSVFSAFSFLKTLRHRVRSGDILVVSGPPHGMMLIASAFRCLRRVRLVLDYRDGWNSQEIFRPKGRFARWIAARLERFCLWRADLVAFASPEFPRLVRRHLGVALNDDRSILVMNGWVAQQSNLPQLGFPDDGIIRIGYFGVANDRPGHYRNILPIIDELREFFDSGALELHIFGQFEIRPETRVGLPVAVKVQGLIAACDVIPVAARYDLLLLVHLDPMSVEEAIPAKLFDYLAARRPVVCVSEGTGAAANLVSQLGAGFVTSTQRIKWTFGQILTSKVVPVFNVSDEMVNSFQRLSQYKRLHVSIRERWPIVLGT